MSVDSRGEQNRQLHAGYIEDNQLKQYCNGFMLLQHIQVVGAQGCTTKLYFSLLWNMEIKFGVTIQ